MIHPLIECDNRALRVAELGDGILGEHGDAVGVDHLRNAVIDLRVDMVRAAGKDDAVHMMLCHVLERLSALHLDILAALGKFLPAGADGVAHFLLRNGIRDIVRLRHHDTGSLFLNLSALRILSALREFIDERIRDGAQGGEGEERIAIGDLTARDFIHIVADVLRIGGDNRAVVVVVGLSCLGALIEQRRVEDEVHLLMNQPRDMPMHEFCRIAGGLGGNGFDAELVDLVCRSRGKDHAVAEFPEEDGPEGVILIHIEHAGNADRAAGRLVSGQRLVVEDPLQLVFVEVRNAVRVLLPAESALTAVAGDELASAGETVDGEAAVVAAALAVRHARLKLEIFDLLEAEHGGVEVTPVRNRLLVGALRRVG